MKKILKISAFYLGLMIVVTALASIAFYTSYQKPQKIESKGIKAIQKEEKAELPQPTNGTDNEIEDEIQIQKAVSAPVDSQNVEQMIKPLDTEIITPYSEQLAYSEYFEDWRAHTSNDFDGGGEVQCVKDGTVSRIYNHPAYGLTAEINHGDGLVTVYASLSDTHNIKEGDNVSVGQTIASGGTSCPADKTAAVHFTATVNGKAYNPFK